MTQTNKHRSKDYETGKGLTARDWAMIELASDFGLGDFGPIETTSLPPALERWKENNRDWVGDHPELWDGSDE